MPIDANRPRYIVTEGFGAHPQLPPTNIVCTTVSANMVCHANENNNRNEVGRLGIKPYGRGLGSVRIKYVRNNYEDGTVAGD
jgi:hypothetical protein